MYIVIYSEANTNYYGNWDDKYYCFNNLETANERAKWMLADLLEEFGYTGQEVEDEWNAGAQVAADNVMFDWQDEQKVFRLRIIKAEN